jgi:Phage tail protein (Tail_P2_I)
MSDIIPDVPGDPYAVHPVTLLPHAGSQTLFKEAEGFERAFADMDAERLMGIQAEIIKAQWNPYQISEQNLPFLAWAMGVNLWEDWWTLEFKRAWVARQWQLKQWRGTRRGLEEFIRAVGGEVRRVVSPPARTYLGKRMTDAEQAAYVGRFPQLRVYPYVARLKLKYLCFLHGKTVTTLLGRPPYYGPPVRVGPPVATGLPDDGIPTGLEGTSRTVLPLVVATPKKADWAATGAAATFDGYTRTLELVADTSEGPHQITATLAKPSAPKPYRVMVRVQRRPAGAARDLTISVGRPDDDSGAHSCGATIDLTTGQLTAAGDVGNFRYVPSLVTAEGDGVWVVDFRCHSDNAPSLQVTLGCGEDAGDGVLSGLSFLGLSVTSEIYARNGYFMGGPLYPTTQDAGGQYTRTATLWDRGVETPLTVRKIQRVVLPGAGGYGWTPGTRQYDEEIVLPLKERVFYYMGQHGKFLSGGKRFGIYLGKEKPIRTITIGRTGELDIVAGQAIYQTIRPDLELLRIAPEYVATRHPKRKGELYLGKGNYLRGKFLPRSNAWQYLYERWYLFDESRVPDYRKGGSSYLGTTRLGIAPYTAIAYVKMHVPSPRKWVHIGGFLSGYLRPRSASTEPIQRLRRGARAAMAMRDTVLLDTNCSRPLQVRDIRKADGKHKVGQLIESF